MDMCRRFQRNLFLKNEKLKRCLEDHAEFSKRRKTSECFQSISSDISDQKDPDDEDEALCNIETYLSSDDVLETNVTDIVFEQDDDHKIWKTTAKNLDKTPEIGDYSEPENGEWPLSPVIQPVDSDDAESFQLPDSSICISDSCSPPDNCIPPSPSHVISASPFKSPNIKREDNVVSESKQKKWVFKTPNNKRDTIRNAYSSGRKRKKFITGGFAEQFEKFSSKEQSDQAIWRHQKHRLHLDNDSKLTLRVISVKKQYSNTFVVCRNLNADSNVIVTSAFIESLKLETGNTINVYNPWTTFKLEDNSSSIMCANFIEVIDRCSKQLPKIARSVFEWTCSLTDDSEIKPGSRPVWASNQVIDATSSRLNRLDCIFDVVENEEFFLIAYVQRVFHYFLEPSKTETWSFLLQDKKGIFAELNLKSLDSTSKWLSSVQSAEGKLFSLGPLCLQQKVQRNGSAKLFSMIHTLQNRHGIKFNRYQQFCIILTLVRENFSIIEEKNNSQCYSFSEPQTINSILQNFTEGHRYSSVVKVLFVYENKLYVTDDSCDSKIRPNYFVLLQTNAVIQCSNLDVGCVLYLKDLQFIRGIFLLDKYTRVYCLTCKSDTNSNANLKINSERIEKLKQFAPIFKNLTSEAKDQELITVSGTILRPNEETSFSWPVCSICNNQMLTEMENGAVFCDTCNCIVRNPVIKMQLEVFITNQSLPVNSTVKLRLTNRTIENLLPTVTDDNSYDAECITNKQIGPLNCFIEQIHPLDDPESQMMVLREI